ncbi:MAG: hypothetical protein IKU07_05840 [Oscillospiraceae bacterium]|nr:hypothetical protein [Oscillospiraceae bacterium]
MTTKELYDAIICKPDLHSHPVLHDNILIWHLYKNAYVQAFCHDGDTSIDIIDNSIFSGSIMHWHPNEDDMISELYAFGKKGNMLVLKKSLFGTSVFYLGPAETFPITDRRSLHFGKKKWDGGQLVYLEQK